MSKFTNRNWIDFEICVMDLMEEYNPKTEEECEDFSRQLHEHAEVAIQDYVMDSDTLSDENYEPYC